MNTILRTPPPLPASLTFDLDLEVDDFEIVEDTADLLAAADGPTSWGEPGSATSVHEAILRFLDEKF